MIVKGIFIFFIFGINGKEWSLDPSRKKPPAATPETPPESAESPIVTPGENIEAHIAPKLQKLPPDPPACSMTSFMRVDRAETRRWCRSLTDIDRSKEATVNLLRHLMARLELVGEKNNDKNELTLRVDPEIFDILSTLDNETELVVSEIIDRMDNMFLPIPVDRRNRLVRILDEFGIDIFHFQIATGITGILTALLTLRHYGFGILEHFGFSFLIKYGFLVAWALNIPIAYINELETEKAKWEAAKVSMMPEGCDGQELSTWTTVTSWFSFTQLKDPCEKWHQSLMDPIYKVSWLGVASQSAVEVVGPAFKVITKHIRGSLDELLDDLGLYHQLMYTAITFAILVLFFMWISNFQFKINGVLLGVEFGPRDQPPRQTISIEDIRSEFRKMGKELSIEMKSERHKNQLQITTVENISSRPKTFDQISDISAGGDCKKLSKESSEESEFEHLSDEN